MQQLTPTDRAHLVNTPDSTPIIVSLTPNAKGQPAKQGVDLKTIIVDIASDRWREPIEAIRKLYAETLAATGDHKAAKKAVDPLKKKLPGIMPAGTFKQRGDAHLETYSGILCADLDHLDPAAVEAAFAKAKNDPHVVAAFRSPTGTGLKIWFRVAGTAAQHDNATFRAVRKHVTEFYGLPVDESCKNLERLCFVSYDPQAIWNDAAVPLPLLVEDGSSATNGGASKPKAGPTGHAPPPEHRSRIAVELLGPIEWTSPDEGFCTCPGQHLHTTGDAACDCKVHLDGAPTIHCFHNSCQGIRDGVNRELRSRIGKAERYAPSGKNGEAHTRTEAGSQMDEAPTPNAWFKRRFPILAEAHGEPVLEVQNKKDEIPRVVDVSEDFLAAVLSEAGQPGAPTVFIPKEERFYCYEPAEGIFVRRSEPELSARLSRLLLECARACRANCDVSKMEFGMRDTAALGGMLRRARALTAKGEDFFNRDVADFIAVANGMLRLQDRQLVPFSPAYRRRNKLAVAYDPHARCPLFLNTLMRPALDDDDLNLLQRWCGLALLGENLAQKLLLVTGNAGGGKGAFVRVVCGIIGQVNLASLRTGLLEERFELGRLLGRTLLYGADVPADFLNQRSASVLKSLTGGDPVTVEMKNSNEVPAIVCRFNVIVTSNSRLTVHLDGDTDAWRRRLALVRYTRPKPAHVIADLSERILREEAAGVLNWMLDGLEQLRADGWQLHLNARQQRRVDDLLLESDSHGEFIRRCLVKDTHATVTLNDAFAAYVDFCAESGWTASTRNQFGRRLPDAVVQAHGCILRRDIKDAAGKAHQGWKGLRLVSAAQWSGKKASEASGDVAPDDFPEASEAFPEPQSNADTPNGETSSVPEAGPEFDQADLL